MAGKRAADGTRPGYAWWTLPKGEVSDKQQPEPCDCFGGFCARQWCPSKRRLHDLLRSDHRYEGLRGLTTEIQELADDDR